MNTGMVTMENRLTTATVCEAVSRSLPYFAANMTVLFAVGAEAEMSSAVKSTPEMPQRRSSNSITQSSCSCS